MGWSAVGWGDGHLPDLSPARHTRDGFDRRDRHRFVCRPCHRDFTHASSGAFSGYRWPPEVIVTAVRWYLSYPLSARQVTELLGERGIVVWARTVLTCTQTFGPQLATAARRHRRRLGRRWYIDEVFLFRGAVKRYLYRAVDEHGQVVDVLLRERLDLASAQAFFRRARATAETQPAAPSPITISPTSGQPSRTCQARGTFGPASIV